MKKNGEPDRFVNQFEAFGLVTGSPQKKHSPDPKYGELNVADAWGVTKSYPIGTPGPFPVHTPDRIVLKDIDEWRKYIKVPCAVYDAQEWEPFIETAEKVNRKEQFVTACFSPGVFELCHSLMEIQNCLAAFCDHPGKMHELIGCITQYELDYAAEVCKYIKPEALLCRDDWGSHVSTYLPGEMFREFIKPAYARIYDYYRSCGVSLIIHHSASCSAELVPDMIDIGVDIWQGVLSANDIPELIRQYAGRITFMGGIDSAGIDHEGWTQEIIHDRVFEVCAKCGKHSFIPGTTHSLPPGTYPGVYEAVSEEIDHAGRELFPSLP